jgi:hypothetical protein
MDKPRETCETTLMMKHPVNQGVAAALFLLAAAGTGCRLIQTAADAPGQAVRAVTPGAKKPAGTDPVEIQALLIRFADAFIARATAGVDALRREAEPLPLAERLRWKLAFGSSVCAIASGANARANLFDMTAYVMETRLAIETNGQPDVFGDSAAPLLESCRTAEAELWRIGGKILAPAQQADLREAVELWHRQNPSTNRLPGVRAVGLALEVVQARRPETARGGNLLGLLMLDPLAELDPARRELAETRLFAERALFVARIMPTLLRWQTELLSLATLEQPVVLAWTTNVTRVADAAARLSATAEQLPQQVAAERDALLAALQSQEQALRPLVVETRQALLAGSGLATNLATTLAAFDGVLDRLDVGGAGNRDDAGRTAGDEPGEPFRIQDYGEAAGRLEAAAQRLTELLQTFDQTLGANSRSALTEQIAPIVRRTRSEGEALADHLFRRAVQLVVAMLLAALAYLLLATRLGRTRGASNG